MSAAGMVWRGEARLGSGEAWRGSAWQAGLGVDRRVRLGMVGPGMAGMARNGWAWPGPARQAGLVAAGRGVSWHGQAGEASHGWAAYGRARSGVAGVA